MQRVMHAADCKPRKAHDALVALVKMREEVPRRIARLWQAPQHNVVEAVLARRDGMAAGVAPVLERHRCGQTSQPGLKRKHFNGIAPAVSH